MFFVSGDPTPTNAGVRLLKILAAQLSRMPNSLVIEGHTDRRPFPKSTLSTGYGNWGPARDRANTAWWLLHVYGVRSHPVVEMRGFHRPPPAVRRQSNNDPRNRRVSLVVKFEEPGRVEPTNLVLRFGAPFAPIVVERLFHFLGGLEEPVPRAALQVFQ